MAALKTIQLNKVGRKIADIKEFKEKLISNLGDKIFDYPTLQIFLFNILKQIVPINKNLEPDDGSIEYACGKVLQYFGLLRDVKVRKLEDSGWKEVKTRKNSHTENFCQKIIGIDKLPSTLYKLLSESINNDLVAITKLIEHYEEQPCILKYNRDNEIPKIHEDRIIYDFYKRCIDERVKILNYFLNGLKERALTKSRYVPPEFKFVFSFSERYDDRPYHFAQPFSIHNFDYRKIDSSGHRVGEFSIGESIKMQKIYSENKEKFYRIYFKKTPVIQHFQRFKFYLSHLPLKNNRNQIFDELIRLFKAKRWISFYALALPQVEGIFTEMCLAVAPNRDLSQKSLTHKVNSVRPFHYLSGSYFDYYQYRIPSLRNKFAHTGYDDDFKLKSYDLLVDLSHILQVFYELENPLVKIKKLHVRRNFEDFITIEEFVNYFKLVNGLKPIQKEKIKNDIENFERDFLTQDCGIDYTCFEVIQNFPKILAEFIQKINKNLSYKGIQLELNKCKFSEIETLFQKETSFETIKDCFLYEKDTVDKLENYLFFISTHKKNLPSLRTEIATELNVLQKNLKEEIKIFNYLNTELKNKNVS